MMETDVISIAWIIAAAWAILYPRKRYLFKRFDRERDNW